MQKRKIIFPLLFVLLGIYFFFIKTTSSYHKTSGLVFGTYYSFTYEFKDNSMAYEQLEVDIQKQLDSVNQSLSTFDKKSIISQINTNQNPLLDEHFVTVYEAAHQVSEITHGAFDLTVAPLVNMWGFGFHPDSTTISQQRIDSVLQYCGYQKVKLVDRHLVKQDPRTMLDASGIAKGYGVDVVARVFDKYGVKNYLVDIGGEIICKGNNQAGKAWTVGIDKPIDDPLATNRELQDTLHIHDAAMATSGSYRQFYEKAGVKYSHEIDPHQGRPVHHATLSTTVIAPSCMVADAYATAFMVLGVDESIAVAESQANVSVYIIYSDGEGHFKTKQSSGFKKYLKNN